MNLKKVLLTNNDCYKSNIKITPKGIMVHSTGANNPNLSRYVQPDDGTIGVNKYGTHWNQPTPGGRQVCVHAFIGKLKDGSIATIQTLPWNIRGWHSGSGSKGSANRLEYIGFEICEDGLNDKAYFDKVYLEAVELCAFLCNEYKLSPMDNIICHSEGYKQGIASNHGDVMHWFPKHGKNMDTFRKDVKNLMNKNNNKEQSNSISTKDKLYRVQVGAFSIKSNADKLANELKSNGYSTYVIKVGNLYKVQVGAFSIRTNATKLANELKSKGYSTFIV